jgi:hypothetical protein
MPTEPIKVPGSPNEEQSTQPPRPAPEIDPGKPATKPEVDLDSGRTDKYPKTTPPERH